MNSTLIKTRFIFIFPSFFHNYNLTLRSGLFLEKLHGLFYILYSYKLYLYIGVVCPCLTHMTNVTRSPDVGGVMLHGRDAGRPATTSTLVVITENKEKNIFYILFFVTPIPHAHMEVNSKYYTTKTTLYGNKSRS